MNPTQNPSALRSKKLITETLLEILKKYPLNEITVKHILLEANISRKTFYRNFTSKEDVLYSYIDSILAEYKDTVIKKQKASFIDIFDIIFNFCEINRELLFILRNNNLLHIPLMKLNCILPSLHQNSGEYIVLFNIGGIWNVIMNWIENDMRDSSDNIKESLTDYLTDIKDIDLKNL